MYVIKAVGMCLRILNVLVLCYYIGLIFYGFHFLVRAICVRYQHWHRIYNGTWLQIVISINECFVWLFYLWIIWTARYFGGGVVAIATAITRRILKTVQIAEANAFIIGSESRFALVMPIKPYKAVYILILTVLRRDCVILGCFSYR